MLYKADATVWQSKTTGTLDAATAHLYEAGRVERVWDAHKT